MPIFLNDCVEAEHLEDAMPLSELPAGGFLRKDSFDTNGIVVSRLGEKMRDYAGYQTRLEQLLSENKTDDEICRVLAKMAIQDLCSFGIKSDGNWEAVKVEVDASFSEVQTKHNDNLPVTIRHSVFDNNSNYGAKDLVSTSHTSSLSYRGEKKVAASHERSKKAVESRKSRGVLQMKTMFNNSSISLGTHSIEESEEKKNNAKLLATVTKRLVKKDKTAMPNTKQYTRMLEDIGSRVLKDKHGRIIDSRKLPNPDGPSNTQVILREYKKAMAERDPCKYHRVMSVFILSAYSARHSLIVLPSSLSSFYQEEGCECICDGKQSDN